MIILAHRGNLTGPEPDRENALDFMSHTLSSGFGLETDIRRRADGSLYIAHDPAPHDRPDGSDAAWRHAALWRAHPSRMIALNVKETGWDEALVSFVVEQRLLSQVMLFDMELTEPVPGGMARRFRELHPYIHIAARVSDRGESAERALSIVEARSIWLDEFDSLWVTRDTITRLRDAGRAVYAISPELHGFSESAMRARWDDYLTWGVDGLCTDHAVAAAAHSGQQVTVCADATGASA